MKQKILLVILTLCLGIAGYTFYTAWRMQDPEFQRQRTMGENRMIEVPDSDRALVNIDELAQARPGKEGTREIHTPLRPIQFQASIKQAPQDITTDYLQTVFGVIGLDPLPPVSKRMFVETAEGKVIPVYVWDELAGFLTATETPQTFVGFHVYTYSKGPAIVVDGVI